MKIDNKGRQQDLTDVDVKANEDTDVGSESITTAIWTWADLIKKDPRHKIVTRNQEKKALDWEIVSVLIELDPKTYNQAMESVKEGFYRLRTASLEETRTWNIVPIIKEIKAFHKSGYLSINGRKREAGSIGSKLEW